MLLQVGDFQYVVLLGAKPKVWTWSVYHPAGANGDPVQQGEFHGSEGRAHMAAREAISRLREKRALPKFARGGQDWSAEATVRSYRAATPA